MNQKLSKTNVLKMLVFVFLVIIPIIFFLYVGFTRELYVSTIVSITVSIVIGLLFYKYKIPILRDHEIWNLIIQVSAISFVYSLFVVFINLFIMSLDTVQRQLKSGGFIDWAISILLFFLASQITTVLYLYKRYQQKNISWLGLLSMYLLSPILVIAISMLLYVAIIVIAVTFQKLGIQ